ncbi:MAG TPA: NADH-quinone oxidoreductase subunit H [Verrucomicrobiota bacterium]|nr:NADH-quinone oxidoreductase subunit H [Verrucomicrobiota bacterium]
MLRILQRAAVTLSVLMAGTLSLPQIVLAQSPASGWWPAWFVFTPWGAAGFVLFLIAANAEANRSPFDLPEGESEIIAGYFIEYSGFKFALFFLGEYLSLFAVSALGVTLFLGGWHAPYVVGEWVPSWVWFFLKLLAVLALFIWTRGTLPRLRQDQLMNFAWKFMIPMTLINVVIAALWHWIGSGPVRWLVCSALVIGAYSLLGRGLMRAGRWMPRTYRFAE